MKKLLIKLLIIFSVLSLFSCWNKTNDKVSNSKNTWTNETTSKTDIKILDTSNMSCEDSYKALLTKYGKNYSDCYFKKPDTSSCEKGNSETPKLNLVIILDDSGSMEADMNGESMLEVAKDKVTQYIDSLDKNVNLSFILYWHKWDWTEAGKPESCKQVEEIYKFTDTDKNALKSRIKALKPNWWTPIADALKKAEFWIKLQSSKPTKNVILLVSDWKETCGWDPVAEAKRIITSNKDTFIDVIWFNVEWDIQKQLMDIAKTWNWNYYDVKSRLDFDDTFNKTKNFLNTMSCWASKASIELSYWTEAINKYYSCMSRLNEERTYMMVDAKADCKDYFDKELETRYSDYENEFSTMLEDWQTILDNFTNIVDEVEKQFE